MPFAFVIVFVIVALSGWYQSDTHHQKVEAKQDSEAKAVVANMINYHHYIYAHAKVEDANGKTPNMRNLRNHRDANSFIQDSRSKGYIPDEMSWFNGPMQGVKATIDSDGRIGIVYEQIAPQYPSVRGVKSEITRVTKSSPSLKSFLVQ